MNDCDIKIQAEIHYTNRIRQMLERWDWDRGERHLKYEDDYGNEFEIQQLAFEMIGGETQIKTMFMKNGFLHRLDGPAYELNRDEDPKSSWYVNGKEYNENEYNFFITGMFEHVG